MRCEAIGLNRRVARGLSELLEVPGERLVVAKRLWMGLETLTI